MCIQTNVKMFPVNDHYMRILCHNTHPAAELIIRDTNVRLHNTIAWSPNDVTDILKLVCQLIHPRYASIDNEEASVYY